MVPFDPVLGYPIKERTKRKIDKKKYITTGVEQKVYNVHNVYQSLSYYNTHCVQKNTLFVSSNNSGKIYKFKQKFHAT